MKTTTLRLLLLLLFTTFGTVLVPGENLHRVIPLDSEMYELTDAIFLEQGKLCPSQSRPWTEDELLLYLKKVDSSRLSYTGYRAWVRILKYLRKDLLFGDRDGLGFSGSVDLYFEAFLHDPLEKSSGYTDEGYDWLHGYEERKPVLDLEFELWISEFLYLTAVPTVKEEHMTVSSPETPAIAENHFNWPDFENPQIDLYFPFRTLLSTGGSHWNIRFGRDSVSWGHGSTGNLLLSDYSDFLDFVSFSTYWDAFKFTTLYAVMDPYLWDGTDITYSAFFGHRFEFTLFERVSLVINEAVTFGNEYPSLIRDMNPIMIFHNWTIPERANSLFTIEAAVQPWRYFTLYGCFAMDEFATTYEEDRTGGGGPGTYGYMIGAEAVVPAGPGYVKMTGEWVMTDPWLYNRRTSPYYTNVRRIWSLVTDQYEYIVKPLGYLYGPDSMVIFGSLSYRVPAVFDTGVECTYLSQGEITLQTPYAPAPGQNTPTGIPENSIRFKVYGEFHPWRFITIGSNLYIRVTWNVGHIQDQKSSDIEWTAHCRLGI
jgi:hypothetical protein